MTSDSASVLSVAGLTPHIDESAFLAAGARVVGDVRLGPEASVWYNAVLRGDSASITVGAGSNLQDNVSVGHNAVVHGCTVEDGCLIGMGSVILSGAVIGAGSLVAGGALVLGGTIVPPGSMVAGVPAKVRRELTEEEKLGILRNAEVYRAHTAAHREARDVGE